MNVSIGTLYDTATMRVICPHWAGKEAYLDETPPPLDEWQGFLLGFHPPEGNFRDYVVDLSDPASPVFIHDPLPVAGMDARRARAKARVDRMANEWALQFISPGEETMEAYRDKREEALAWQADPENAVTPYAQAEADQINALMGPGTTTRDDVLALYLANALAWRSLNIQLQAIRVATKAAIDAAATAEDINTIMANIVWPQPSEA